jgi:hypothetical protein
MENTQINLFTGKIAYQNIMDRLTAKIQKPTAYAERTISIKNELKKLNR